MEGKNLKDQLNREIHIPDSPKRIVSLVPSQTELLADLGLGPRVVGITRFCVRPSDWFTGKNRVGGTKDISLDAVRTLNPDLIIANREENTEEQVLVLADEFPVWVSDVNDLPSALDMIHRLADITGTGEKGREISEAIVNSFTALSVRPALRTVYLIWRRPYMAAGSDTFIHDMMQRCGLVNAIADTRYPELTCEQLHTMDPDLVLLSSEPYPFREKHIAEMRDILPKSTVLTVDGEMFSWYGSRLRHSASYLHGLRNRIGHGREA